MSFMKEFFDEARLAGLEGSEFETFGRLSIAAVSCRKQLDSGIPDFWSCCTVSTFRGGFKWVGETEVGEKNGSVD